MTGVGEGAGATAKVLEVVKDLPLWLLTGLALSAGGLLWVPWFAPSVPALARPWIMMAGVVCGILAGVRAIALLIEKIPAWRASADARRRFHLTGEPQQSFWSSAKQADDSIVTQVVARLLIKKRTTETPALVSARLISPKIHGEIVHAAVSGRAVNRNIYCDAVHSGHMIPPAMSLPASVGIYIRGVPRRKIDKLVRAVIAVTDDEGHEEKIAVDMRVVSSSIEGKAGAPPLEMVSSISNPIEREIASVLQAELARYDKLGRMDGKAYLRITYFIVCVLWKIGKLREALEKAKAELPQGEINVFGLSNTLMLFNGLLRYRYPDFTNDMLDEIEKFLNGLNEHPFQIPEKIAVIRTARLMGNARESGSAKK